MRIPPRRQHPNSRRHQRAAAVRQQNFREAGFVERREAAGIPRAQANERVEQAQRHRQDRRFARVMAQLIDELVFQDADQPGLQLRLATERLRPLQCPGINLRP